MPRRVEMRPGLQTWVRVRVNDRLHIAQIGPWPTPWGGISVYVQRLSQQLARRGHRITVLDSQGHTVPTAGGIEVVPSPPSKRQALDAARAMAARGVEVAQLHLIGLPWKTVVPFAAACEAVGIPLIISVHSYRTFDAQAPLPHRAMLHLAGNRLAYAFGSGAHVADRLVRSGIPAAKVAYVAPFIAPEPASPRDARLPPKLRDFVAQHSPIVSAGAAALVAEDGRDLYGFDTFIALANAVAAAHPDAGFVFQLPRHGDAALFSQAMAQAGGLGERLLIHTDALDEGSDLWAVSDLFVRPTLSDGDSVSVREALCLGTPTLASDAVARPDGVHLFVSGSGDDAARVALRVLADLPAARAAVAQLEPPRALDTVEAALQRAATRGQLPSRLARGVLRRVASAVAQRTPPSP